MIRRMRRLWQPGEPGAGDASPFWQPRGKRNAAVLCLHGLTGTPYEVRPLAQALASHGFAVSAPCLAGHGGTPAGLAATTFADWLDSAREALDRLREESGDPSPGVAGFSMGGLLALRLAATQPQGIRALAILSAPLRLTRWERIGIRMLARLPVFARVGPLASIPKMVGSDVLDERVRSEVPSLTVTPVPALASLLDLMRIVRDDLPGIHVPALVAHGKRDRTVPFADALEIANNLGSQHQPVEKLWLPHSGHLVCVDGEKQTLAAAVINFFDRHLI